MTTPDEVDGAGLESFPPPAFTVTTGTGGARDTEPPIVVENREELIYLLTEAAEIEHGLMCCYLYAAYSLRVNDPALRVETRAMLSRWRNVVVDIAKDEMTHLALVSNLLSAIGSAPHFARANFPVARGYHPAGIIVSLAPFDRGTLDPFERTGRSPFSRTFGSTTKNRVSRGAVSVRRIEEQTVLRQLAPRDQLRRER